MLNTYVFLQAAAVTTIKERGNITPGSIGIIEVSVCFTTFSQFKQLYMYC